MTNSIFDIQINDHSGQPIDLNSYKGKKILIVNVASECGFTRQYDGLQELYSLQKGNLEIIGIPCNDFGGQEPGTEEEIVSFCRKNYGVDFIISEKVGILDNVHPLYQWLTLKENNGINNHEIKWNFHKFLLNEDGSLHASMPSSVEPLGEEILGWISK